MRHEWTENFSVGGDVIKTTTWAVEDGRVFADGEPESFSECDSWPNEILRLAARVKELEGGQPLTPFERLSADRLADEVAALVTRGFLDSRSAAADALLDYREPPRTERSDRVASLEAELAYARTVAANGALWMRSHDALLSWCQSRPELLADLAAANLPPLPNPDDCRRLLALEAENQDLRVHVEELQAMDRLMAEADLPAVISRLEAENVALRERLRESEEAREDEAEADGLLIEALEGEALLSGRRVEVVETQTHEGLRFDLLDRAGNVVRSVFRPWTAMRDLGGRNKLYRELFAPPHTGAPG